MKGNFKAVIILPNEYNSKQHKLWPVVYLLHGYDGRYDNWINKVPELKNYAEQFSMIIVCPEGSRNSWYIDSQIDSNSKYETYIINEIIPFIDQNYRTDKSKRAITGLSMGGHGALSLAFKHPGSFIAAGSMSGILNLSDIAGRYDTQAKIGDTLVYRNAYKKHSAWHLADSLKSLQVNIIIDCGVNDAFISSNRAMHKKLLDLEIKHDYIERPGKHDWNYWAKSVAFQLFYFHKIFKG